MDDFEIQEKIIRLRVTIRWQEEQITTLEEEVRVLRAQLAPIMRRYERVVGPLADRVEALREAVREMEALRVRRKRGADTPIESLWEEPAGMGSFGHNATPEPEVIMPTQRPKASEDIKKVYRRLARRYHPDLAQNDVDRDQRNRLMAQVNEAYAERDMDALLALDDKQADTNEDDTSLLVLKLRRLQTQSAELSEQIEDLKIERFDLTHSPLMDLKIQEKFDKRKGKNLLEEMAAKLEAEYQQLSVRLEQLRRSL